MKKLITLVLIFLLSGSSLAAQADSDRKPEQNEKQVQRVTKPESENKIQPLPSKGEPWPRTFVPSERIKADTVVSFPADI